MMDLYFVFEVYKWREIELMWWLEFQCVVWERIDGICGILWEGWCVCVQWWWKVLLGGCVVCLLFVVCCVIVVVC